MGIGQAMVLVRCSWETGAIYISGQERLVWLYYIAIILMWSRGKYDTEVGPIGHTRMMTCLDPILTK